MGSVRHRLTEVRHADCNVVLVGDVRVGKSALVNRFINNKFTEVRNSFLDLQFYKFFLLFVSFVSVHLGINTTLKKARNMKSISRTKMLNFKNVYFELNAERVYLDT